MPEMLVAGQVSLETLCAVYEDGHVPELAPDYFDRLKSSADRVAAIVNGEEVHYGVNTGFGKLASVRIPTREVEALQRNLVLSHCCSLGEPLPANVERSGFRGNASR